MYTPHSQEADLHDTDELHVSDVLATQPQLREATIRTHGPAIVLVLELDAPAHWHSLCTPEEFGALCSWLQADPRAAATWEAFHSVDADRGQAELLERAERESAWRDQLYPESIEDRDQARQAKAEVTKALRS